MARLIELGAPASHRGRWHRRRAAVRTERAWRHASKPWSSSSRAGHGGPRAPGRALGPRLGPELLDPHAPRESYLTMALMHAAKRALSGQQPSSDAISRDERLALRARSAAP